MANPKRPDFIHNDSRNATFTPIVGGADVGSPPEGADSSVEEPVDEDEDEDGHDEKVRVNRSEGYHNRRVELADRVEEQLTDALVIENGLGDNGALPR